MKVIEIAITALKEAAQYYKDEFIELNKIDSRLTEKIDALYKEIDGMEGDYDFNVNLIQFFRHLETIGDINAQLLEEHDENIQQFAIVELLTVSFKRILEVIIEASGIVKYLTGKELVEDIVSTEVPVPFILRKIQTAAKEISVQIDKAPKVISEDKTTIIMQQLFTKIWQSQTLGDVIRASRDVIFDEAIAHQTWFVNIVNKLIVNDDINMVQLSNLIQIHSRMISLITVVGIYEELLSSIRVR